MYIKCDKLQNLTPCQFYESKEIYLENATKILSLCAEARTIECDIHSSEIRVKYLLTIKAIYQTEDGLVEVKEDVSEQTNAIRCSCVNVQGVLIDTIVTGVEYHGLTKIKVRVMLEQKGVMQISGGFSSLEGGELVTKNATLKATTIAPLRGTECVVTSNVSCKHKLGKILTACANICVKNVSQATDIWEIDGEATVYATHLFGGEILGETFLAPFHLELQEEGVSESSKIAHLLKPLSVSIVTTESDDGAEVEVELLLSVGGYYLDSAEVEYPIDAYSKTKEVVLKKADAVVPDSSCCVNVEERFSEVVPFESITDAEEILCISAPYVGASSLSLTPDATIQGIVCLEALLKLDGGALERVVTEVPFSIALRDKIECTDNLSLDIKVSNINCRLRYGSAVEVSGNLAITIEGYTEKVISYLEDVEELGERIKNDSVISVYLVGEGETLFDCAKALRSDEEELLQLNPDLSLPLKPGDKVLLYHPL